MAEVREIRAMLRCYDCNHHVLDAQQAEEHREKTGHNQWEGCFHVNLPSENNETQEGKQ